MKEFLNTAMKKHQGGETKKATAFFDAFPKMTKMVIEKLGDKPFCLRGPLNISALDSVCSVLIENIGMGYADSLGKRYEALKYDKDFQTHTSYNTTDSKTVEDRIKAVRRHLLGSKQMAYTDRFTHADDIVQHLNTVIPSLSDPLLQAKYVGFVAVAAVTVYEMAIKEIFISFGRKKHRVLGVFTESFFDRINGKIKLDVLKKEYISKFGERYKIRFSKKLKITLISISVNTNVIFVVHIQI